MQKLPIISGGDKLEGGRKIFSGAHHYRPDSTGFRILARSTGLKIVFFNFTPQ